MEIRIISEKEIEAVRSLEEKIFQRSWNIEEAEKTVAREDVLFLVALSEKEELMGYAEFWISYENADLCHIAVDIPYRRKGIAGALLQEGILLCKEKEVTQMMLEVRKSNEAAIGLYESMDFAPISIRKKYYKMPEEDAIIYCRKL